MPILIDNPILSTWIFSGLLAVALAISVRPKKDSSLFPVSVTQELKGFAILAIIFAHVGYFLVTDHHFLFPLSIMAGVGVNLFLFVSGYGMTISTSKKDLSVKEFYRRHIPKLYVPFWLILGILFVCDFVFLGINYGWHSILQSVLGFFPRADLYLDIDSPLWYFTFIVFYYLLFPWVFSKKRPWLSAIILFVATILILQCDFSAITDVRRLYTVHTLAFPLGMVTAWLFTKYASVPQKLIGWFRRTNIFAYAGITALLFFVIYYTRYFPGINTSNEQLIGIVTVLAIIILFLIKKFEVRLLYVFGIYSYELYLIHWPIMYRYDFLFKYLPAWLAMASYLALFLGIGWVIKRILETRTK